MAKEKKRLSANLDLDIHEKLTQYAEEHRITVTTAITQWVINLKVDGEPQIHGQMSLK